MNVRDSEEVAKKRERERETISLYVERRDKRHVIRKDKLQQPVVRLD